MSTKFLHEKIQIELLCHHKIWFPKPAPRVGDIIWCFGCQDERMVTQSSNQQGWQWRCFTCSGGRKFGGNRIACEMAAVKHRHTNGRMHHHVIIMNNGKLEYDFKGDDSNQLSIEDIPPF